MAEKENYVVDLLPEIQEIADLNVRQKVIRCWLMALERSEWNKIEDMPWSPGAAEFITNIQHTRGVARIGMAIARTIISSQDLAPGVSISLDTVIAGCLLHDMGKMLEYAGPSNKKGEKTPLGKRMKHDILGVHLAIEAGLDAEIVHCIEAHRQLESLTGSWYTSSLESKIVGWADHIHAFAMVRAHPELDLRTL